MIDRLRLRAAGLGYENAWQTGGADDDAAAAPSAPKMTATQPAESAGPSLPLRNLHSLSGANLHVAQPKRDTIRLPDAPPQRATGRHARCPASTGHRAARPMRPGPLRAALRDPPNMTHLLQML